MKAKFFTGGSREEAVAQAERFFGCDRGDITFEAKSGDEVSASWLILGMTGASGTIANANAGFGIYYEEDGVYLEIYEKRGSGRPLDEAQLTRHINRKGITGANSSAVTALVESRSGRAMIASKQVEHIYGEDLAIEISSDEQSATVTLLEPEPGGKELDYATAESMIQNAGVQFGLNEDTLKALLAAKDYGRHYVVATATQPEDGEDAKLVFHFSTDERTGRPREIGGGRVDYRSLDLYEPVTEGQLLVTRTLATEGSFGTSVTGKVMKPKPGKDINLPRGKNVDINDEKTEMRAKCSGMVDFQSSSINVSSVYKINGDCDLSVGNIDFDGSVHISGSVRSGHTVKATGGIVVGGTVEAATLIAGGNIEVKGGMQGADKGRLEAGGSITIMFIERGTAVADGSITVDVSIHSTLEAGGTLHAKGRRGAIIGGRAGAAGNVITNCIGAISRTQTEIEVGVMPRKRVRISHLEKEIDRLKAETVKLDQLDTYLGNTKGKLDQATWDKLHLSGVENRRLNDQTIEDYNLELADLKYELEHATEGRVHVFDVAYDGTKIIIGNGVYKVIDDVKYATFRYKDAEVVYGPCEVSKS